MDNNRTQRYATAFAQWRPSHEVFDTPAAAGLSTSLKAGDKVTFQNGYGIKFPGHRVLGFCRPTSFGGCVYLDIDCYWFPVRLQELTQE